MKRSEIRKLKRSIGAGNSDALVSLLERSVRFKHTRILLPRSMQAELLGVKVLPALLKNCVEAKKGFLHTHTQICPSTSGKDMR